MIVSQNRRSTLPSVTALRGVFGGSGNSAALQRGVVNHASYLCFVYYVTNASSPPTIQCHQSLEPPAIVSPITTPPCINCSHRCMDLKLRNVVFHCYYFSSSNTKIKHGASIQVIEGYLVEGGCVLRCSETTPRLLSLTAPQATPIRCVQPEQYT